MKKTLAIIALIVLLTGGALYTVSAYNKSNSQNTTTGLPKETSQVQNNTNTSGNTPSSQLNNKIKTKAQDFKLKDLNGNEVSLSDYKGKKVFLNFWASWCPPCKAEMPEIEKLYKETKDSDLIILAVDIGEDKQTVKSFIDKNKYNFKVLLDTDQAAATKYNIASIPSSYFIDKDGNIVATHIGSMNLAQMKNYIQQLDK
jgi:thiol-disulfide isomerase/thioredoxin